MSSIWRCRTTMLAPSQVCSMLCSRDLTTKLIFRCSVISIMIWRLARFDPMVSIFNAPFARSIEIPGSHSRLISPTTIGNNETLRELLLIITGIYVLSVSLWTLMGDISQLHLVWPTMCWLSPTMKSKIFSILASLYGTTLDPTNSRS